jgi:isopenicillin-N N-acyltransferase-like protein
MQKPSDMPVLILEGLPRERGRIYGEALKGAIGDFVSGWKSAIYDDTTQDPEEYLTEFIAETGLLAAVERWTPDVLEEVRGIAEGSELEFNTVLALQMPDEEWWYRIEKRKRQAKRGPEHCSALGVYGQGDLPPLLAENLDTPDYFDGYQVLLHIKDPASSIESFVFTVAGLVAAAGVNNQGVGVCCNALPQLSHTADGLPVAFVHRGVLAQPTLMDAVAFIQGIKHATGQNYMIGGPEKIVTYECSANQVCRFVPDGGVTRLLHTNHPLANDDQRRKKIKTARAPSNSEVRMSTLEQYLEAPSIRVDVNTIKSTLGSHDSSEHPLCRHNPSDDGWMTIGCLIMVLSTPPELHLAPGPPCSTEFQTFTF